MVYPRDPSGSPRELQLDADMKLIVGGGTPKTITYNIAIDESLSEVVDLQSCRAAVIFVPSEWTAAKISFRVRATDAGDASPLRDIYGVEYAVEAPAGSAVILPLQDFLPLRHLQLCSGTAASPVAQAAARQIVVVAVAS